ncbi:MAG: hypothetical protein KBT70_17725, partial [Roseovarius sp.]|uniref:hypothetical protein n=1 Tax=Roseovarius sp. TaxID=1486281 RepID=UPI001B4C61F6
KFESCRVHHYFKDLSHLGKFEKLGPRQKLTKQLRPFFNSPVLPLTRRQAPLATNPCKRGDLVDRKPRL